MGHGWATPTEASAFGVLAVLILAVAYRSLTWKALVESVNRSLRASCMVLFILLGSATFSQLLAFSGASEAMAQWALSFNLSAIMVVIVMFLVVLVLGFFMDQVSIMMLTLPIFIPIAMSLKIDMIWLGVVLMMSLEIGLISPPFGLILFVMQGGCAQGHHFCRCNACRIPLPLLAVVRIRPNHRLGADCHLASFTPWMTTPDSNHLVSCTVRTRALRDQVRSNPTI
jgi:TRAP-type mannitol/chloroaromatic compound transport system permease large subunit